MRRLLSRIDWWLFPDYLRFLRYEGRLGSFLLNLLFGVACATVSFAAANQVDIETIDGNEPANAPSFETHEAAAQMVCGGPVLESGNDIVAGHVIVVPLDGKVVRMDTTEAWSRVRSKTTADDVWVIGVCRKDVQW